MQRFFIPLLLLVMAAAVAYAVFSGISDESRGDKELPVEVLRVHEATIHDSVESLGTTIANESVNITANVTETITQIDFTDGQVVRQGDLIALLSQQEERAQLAAAKARLQENQRELKRLETLLKNRAAAQREYDERLTQLEITRQEIGQIEARIADRTLRAPFDGVLGIRHVSVGALVQPGDILTTLDDISRMKLDFAVPSLYLDSLRPGTRIAARRDGFGEEAFDGTVESVDSRVDPVTRAVLVRAILPNDHGLLKPGLLMRVTLLRNERQALVIPEESVLQRAREQFALVVSPEEQVVEERKIRTGIRRPGMVEVLEGLSAGEYVITRGVSMVSPGEQVRIAEVWERIRPPRATNDAGSDQFSLPVEDAQ